MDKHHSVKNCSICFRYDNVFVIMLMFSYVCHSCLLSAEATGSLGSGFGSMQSTSAAMRRKRLPIKEIERGERAISMDNLSEF